MAKQVSEFPQVRRGRPEVYPYKQWFNGKKWALKQGEDFHVEPESFKAALYARKNAMNLVIRTATITDAETGLSTVYVQRLSGAVAKNRAAKNKGLGRKAA